MRRRGGKLPPPKAPPVPQGGGGANVIMKQNIPVLDRPDDVLRVTDPWSLLSVSDPKDYEKDMILPNPDLSWIDSDLGIHGLPEEDDKEFPQEDEVPPFQFSLIDG
jgi:hypothetical protein